MNYTFNIIFIFKATHFILTTTLYFTTKKYDTHQIKCQNIRNLKFLLKCVTIYNTTTLLIFLFLTSQFSFRIQKCICKLIDSSVCMYLLCMYYLFVRADDVKTHLIVVNVCQGWPRKYTSSLKSEKSARANTAMFSLIIKPHKCLRVFYILFLSSSSEILAFFITLK